MKRDVRVRYRFALQLEGQTAGLGIERLDRDRIVAFWSIYVPNADEWLESIYDVLDAEKDRFDVVYAQRFRAEDLYELQQIYIFKYYKNKHRLKMCKELVLDALHRKTTITEVLG